MQNASCVSLYIAWRDIRLKASPGLTNPPSITPARRNARISFKLSSRKANTSQAARLVSDKRQKNRSHLGELAGEPAPSKFRVPE
jgi:hypothetical protein